VVGAGTTTRRTHAGSFDTQRVSGKRRCRPQVGVSSNVTLDAPSTPIRPGGPGPPSSTYAVRSAARGERPFSSKGQHLRFPERQRLAKLSDRTVLYSRRIGQPPQRESPWRIAVVDTPLNSTILERRAERSGERWSPLGVLERHGTGVARVRPTTGLRQSTRSSR